MRPAPPATTRQHPEGHAHLLEAADSSCLPVTHWEQGQSEVTPHLTQASLQTALLRHLHIITLRQGN